MKGAPPTVPDPLPTTQVGRHPRVLTSHTQPSSGCQVCYVRQKKKSFIEIGVPTLLEGHRLREISMPGWGNFHYILQVYPCPEEPLRPLSAGVQASGRMGTRVWNPPLSITEMLGKAQCFGVSLKSSHICKQELLVSAGLQGIRKRNQGLRERATGVRSSGARQKLMAAAVR